MTINKYIIPLDPCSQGRPRLYKKIIYDPSKSEKIKYRRYILSHYEIVKMIESPFNMEVNFFCKMPKQWSKKKKIDMENCLKSSIPDLDNLLKFILDMGNQLLWADDALCYSLVAQKLYSSHPRVELELS